MIIRAAEPGDFNTARSLYRNAADHMRSSGLDQWQYGVYPNDQLIAKNIHEGSLSMVFEEDKPVGVYTADTRCPEEYDSVYWLFGSRPIFAHRMAVAPEAQGRGVAREILSVITREGARRGFDTLRLDTYTQNARAMRLYEAFGMRKAGFVYMNGKPDPYCCFEKPLTDDCRMKPIPMTPAWRYGADTPWGGDSLMTEFGKAAPGERAGESLEVSALPGLNSKSPAGEPLTELLEKYGKAMTGEPYANDFPLLLKMIDARDRLSVQVHPNEAYAKTNEGGKHGKEEAWVILRAEEGARIVFGLKPDVSPAELKNAFSAQTAERLLNHVKVKPMDVIHIPAGCVHAVGGGITLWEIQQSSDLTYRLYDYNRVGADGKTRPLHIDKALEVCDFSPPPPIVRAPFTPGISRMLVTSRFTVDSLIVDGLLPLNHHRSFAFLTSLGDIDLIAADSVFHMPKGSTCFIPASGPNLFLSGTGCALLAAAV